MIILLLYGGGLRVSELVGLNYGAVGFQDATVRVRGKGRKERICLIGQSALKAITAFRDMHAKDGSFTEPRCYQWRRRQAIRGAVSSPCSRNDFIPPLCQATYTP